LLDVHLDEGIENTIAWKLTANGEYSAKSAYVVQFIGSTTSIMHKTVWKVWATPKAKFFAWLLMQNRVWTADRLQKRGWPNCGLCPLCKQVTESACHLFVNFRYTIRLWSHIRVWIGNPNIQPNLWAGQTLEHWWTTMTGGATSNRKVVASLTLLVTWELWNERNVRVFRSKHMSPLVLFEKKIKSEARLWVYAGAKRLGEIMPGK
jgi:hypothetical protein